MLKFFSGSLLTFSLICFLLPSCSEEQEPVAQAIEKPQVSSSPVQRENPAPAQKKKVLVKNKKGWKVIKADSFQDDTKPWKAIDGKANTFWHTQWKPKRPKHPHELQIDLGKELEIFGFSYLTRQDKLFNGTVKDYEFFISNDKKKWGEPVSVGTFEDIKYDRGLQVVYFEQSVKGRFIRLVAKSEIDGKPYTCCAEINVVIEQ